MSKWSILRIWRRLWTISLFFTSVPCSYLFWNNLQLEPSLLKFNILTNRTLRQKCVQDKYCPVEIDDGVNKKCWGFESDCGLNQSYSADIIRCSGTSDWPEVIDVDSHRNLFWKQADFGILKQQLQSIRSICKEISADDGFLECSDHLRFCRGRNLFFNFKNLHGKSSKRGHELKHFKSDDEFRVDDEHCDVIFEKPTIIIKLDAAVNMYHHFCDFINLFATQFVNGSLSRDVDILWWETHSDGYNDRDFGVVWKVFSASQPTELVSLDGKRVCLRDVVFSLLARQRRGLYYNMPLVDGCVGSGLFQTFNRHVLHRLDIKQRGPLLSRFRITLLERKTRYRQIINVKELTEALQQMSNVELRIVNYDGGISFEEQLQITQNSDIFIGMHGSGLTHLLFLPDWAVLFELYNCGDIDCYKDLSRLRGINYLTWTKPDRVRVDKPGIHPASGQPHEKFSNYMFDVDEFVRLCQKAIEFVRRHPAFVQQQQRLRRLQKLEF